jgi:hypothetical protein
VIANIIDRRNRPYRWRKVNVVAEATSNDHNVRDSDEMDYQTNDLVYDEFLGCALSDAIVWGQQFECAVTLYLYDEGDGPERTAKLPVA